MEDKQKPLRTAANKMKDLYNTYMRQEEKTEATTADDTVRATTSTDINEVHSHHEGEGQTGAEQSTESHGAELSAVMQEIEDLRISLSSAEKERDELKDKLVRTLAEFDNFRRRTEREKEQLTLYATEKTMSRLVDVLDDLQAALEAGKKSTDYQAMLNGLEMIYQKAHKSYEDHGVKPLDVQSGEPFNVDVHEALMHIPHPDTPEGHVVQQIQRGYTFRDKVLRHAKVITSAGQGE